MVWKWYGKKDSILLSISDDLSNMENNIWLGWTIQNQRHNTGSKMMIYHTSTDDRSIYPSVELSVVSIYIIVASLVILAYC